MTYKFTESAENAIKYANNITVKLGHAYIGTEHILYGLAKEQVGIAKKVLESQNINSENILSQIDNIMGENETKSKKILGFTPRTKKMLENASEEAKKLNSERVGTEHILIGILKEGDSVAIRILTNLGANLKTLYEDILKIATESVAEERKTEQLREKESQEKENSFLMPVQIGLTNLQKEEHQHHKSYKDHNWQILIIPFRVKCHP